jgi:hypothetical protein
MAKKEKAQKKEAFNLSAKLKNVRILEQTDRVKEAIAYLYIIYTDVAFQTFGIAKKVSQSIRDYAIVLVKEMQQNPQNVYPFIQKVEKTIYGGYPITPQIFQDVIQQFGVLYQEVTGKNLPGF